MNILVLKLVLALLLERAGIAPAFITAIVTTLVIQGISLLVMRRFHLSPGEIHA